MESLTKFKLLFEKKCHAMESFDVIERLLSIRVEEKKLKVLHFMLDNGDFKPYLKVPLDSLDDWGDEYLKIFDDHIYYKIYAQRLENSIKVKPNYVFQTGCFFRNDENREYYDKVVDILWNNSKILDMNNK